MCATLFDLAQRTHRSDTRTAASSADDCADESEREEEPNEWDDEAKKTCKKI